MAYLLQGWIVGVVNIIKRSLTFQIVYFYLGCDQISSIMQLILWQHDLKMDAPNNSTSFSFGSFGLFKWAPEIYDMGLNMGVVERVS